MNDWKKGLPAEEKYIGTADWITYKLSSFIAPYLNKYNITPNMITLFGLICNLSYAYIIYHKIPLYGLFCVPVICDCLDGYIARYYNKGTYYGNLFDHYSDWVSAVAIIAAAIARYKYHPYGIYLIVGILYLELQNLQYSSLLQQLKHKSDVSLTNVFVKQYDKSIVPKKLLAYKEYNSSLIGYISIVLFYGLHYSS